MTTFVFPGQGSQRRGMGEDLFDRVPEFTSVERDGDRILGYSVRELCRLDAENRLNDTRFTQPSLYVVNALYHYRALQESDGPRFVAGHSLGEYNALLAAGVFDFLTGLQLVKKRGELMAQAKNGGMAAVVGLPNERVAQLLYESGLTRLDVANYNSSTQTVISGPLADIATAEPLFEKAGASLYMRLPVSAAFHSRYMGPAADAFADFIRFFSFSAPKIPVVANVTAEPYPTTRAESIPTLLVRQITHPVQWTRSIEFLGEQGMTEIKEVGPGNVLTRLVQQIQKAAA